MMQCPTCKGSGEVEERPAVEAPTGSRWRENDCTGEVHRYFEVQRHGGDA